MGDWFVSLLAFSLFNIVGVFDIEEVYVVQMSHGFMNGSFSKQVSEFPVAYPLKFVF